MTIDEAIIMHKQKADSYHKAMPNYGEAADHRQLAKWLTELKELEAKHWDECRQIAHYDDELSKYQKQMPKIVEYIDYLRSLPVNRWISVKDRLPDESCECLGIVDGEVTEVSYSPKCKELICVWSMCDADGSRPLPDDAVTHWMPLPEPPKDGDTE